MTATLDALRRAMYEAQGRSVRADEHLSIHQASCRYCAQGLCCGTGFDLARHCDRLNGAEADAEDAYHAASRVTARRVAVG